MSPQQDSNNEDSAVEDEEEEYDEEDGRPQSKAKRQKLDPAERVLRRREKRLWHEKRKEILFNYMQSPSYPSSVSFFSQIIICQ